MFKKVLTVGAISALLAASTAFAQDAQVDPNLPEYTPVTGIAGNLSSVGSDTLNNLMSLWAEEFQRFYPNVNIEIQGAGSSTAPPALTEGTANFGPMSRLPRDSEQQAFEERHGYPMTVVNVGIDNIAVFVHRDNPIEGLTIEQLDAIFSDTRRCGRPEPIDRWGQLGLTGAWANRDITLFSRNAASGTFGYFRQLALCDGDFRATNNEQPGSSAVVQGVAEAINAIGYSGIGFETAGVRAIALGNPPVLPTAENALDGSYPLARFLYIAVNKDPNRGFPPLEREFLRMVLSRQGQEVVARDGFIPLPESAAARFRAELGLD